MKLSMITRTVTGTIGGYTVTKETTMKQIDTAQLDINACQAQAAEYHARGFNCAQAVACTLAPAVGLDLRSPLPSPRLWCRHGRHDRNLRRHLGRRGHHGLRDERRHGKPQDQGPDLQAVARNRQAFGEKNTTTVCGTLKGIGSDKGPLRSCPGCIDDAIEIACDVLKQLAE